MENKKKGYLNTGIKSQCLGCEACCQICPVKAIKMENDEEGFRYPFINQDNCIRCGLCNNICPVENEVTKHQEKQVAYGGYHNSQLIRESSTSGGAFSAIVETWCDENYVIFGAKSEKLSVYHTYIFDKKELDVFRKSKYTQSYIGNSFFYVKKFLLEGKKVLFSGTPCQIAGLKSFLKNVSQEKLLTIEVVCEGVPSPLFMNKYRKYLITKKNSDIKSLDYRYKDGNKWDFQVMRTVLETNEEIKIDRWFNPYWSIWLSHLMSRPSCYDCPFTTKQRVADITLGDLWGVHIYCPELYGNNGGASLVICNSMNGKMSFEKAKKLMVGHELDLDIALKYQGPLKKSIEMNYKREEFMKQLKDDSFSYKKICITWAKRPNLKLLVTKYIYGNKQKVFLWNIKNRIKEKFIKEE